MGRDGSRQHDSTASGTARNAQATGGAVAWRRLLLAGWAVALILAASCDRRSAPSAPALPATYSRPPGRAAEVAIQAALYPTLDTDPQGHAVLAAYLQAWNRREQEREALSPAREPLLALYGELYRRHVQAGGADAGPDGGLRALWDLAGLAHTTLLAPADIKRATGWTEPSAMAPSDEPPVQLSALQTGTARVPLERLPAGVCLLLTETRLDAPDSPDALVLVRREARCVYFTPQLASWSPNCPMDVCGSSEPLSRTLILSPVSQIDLAPKPDWSLAAVAVHEAAHIAWFHRPEVSAEPRLLLPVPNEREAWRQTAQFLRGLLRSAHPEVRPYVQAHAAEIRAMLQQARDYVRRANRVLHLAEGDEARRTGLPTGVPEAALRALPPG